MSFLSRMVLAVACIAVPQPVLAAASAHEHPMRHKPPVSTLPKTVKLPGVRKNYGGVAVDVLTYHYDSYRTGWNQSETDLTQAAVASPNFGLLTTLNVDGNVFAQPLLATNIAFPDGSTHDVLVIATGHDSVFAYDAESYALLWQISLGTPQSSVDVGCGDVQPEYGISSTPVIVRNGTSAILYVMAATENTPMQFASQLHALNLATGVDAVPPVTFAPTGTYSDGSTAAFDPQNQWNRAGLAYSNGSLYVGVGAHCDNNAFNVTGWLVQYDTNLNQKATFHTIQDPRGGYELDGIWMSGFAPSIDPQTGNVFVVTGNGDSKDSKKDWGESALEFKPGLRMASHFTPFKAKALNSQDLDFGSGGIMLLPPVAGQTAPPMAVALGKSATMYLLNRNDLGSRSRNDAKALASVSLGCDSCGLWGGPAYYQSPVAGPLVLEQTSEDFLRSWQVGTGSTPGFTASATGTSPAGFGGSIPIVSSNGPAAGTGVVWLIRRSSPLMLEAYNADTLGAPLFAANVGNWSNPNYVNAYLTPMEANGRVYVPGYQTVTVFGLTQ